MNCSKADFANVYKMNRVSLTGHQPSAGEIDENYRFYKALVDLSGRDGKLIFKKDEQEGMTWEFSPLAVPVTSK